MCGFQQKEHLRSPKKRFNSKTRIKPYVDLMVLSVMTSILLLFSSTTVTSCEIKEHSFEHKGILPLWNPHGGLQAYPIIKFFKMMTAFRKFTIKKLRTVTIVFNDIKKIFLSTIR
jgi:hypothetical protein